LCAVVLAATGWWGHGASLAEEVFLEVPSPPRQHAEPADLLDDLQLIELDKADRIDRLHEQLSELRRLLDRRRLTPPPVEPDPPPALPDAESPASEGSEPPAHAPLPAEVAERVPTPSDSSSELLPEALVDGPVDRVALADSLFASGEVEFALQAYQQVDAHTLTVEDRLWIEYQLASCHRRLKNYAEAEKRYRSLAGLAEGGPYATQSRWWLDAITARRSLEADLQRVSETIQSLEQQSHASTAPEPR
jgi:hypothetical protein